MGAYLVFPENCWTVTCGWAEQIKYSLAAAGRRSADWSVGRFFFEKRERNEHRDGSRPIAVKRPSCPLRRATPLCFVVVVASVVVRVFRGDKEEVPPLPLSLPLMQNAVSS